MGRWSRRLAPAFVSWLQVPAGAHWLDVGCGTGALTSAICRLSKPASVVGCDPAAPLVEYARSRSEDARVSFVAAGVGALPSRPGGYGSLTSLLALNFFPDSHAALRELHALAAPGASLSACVWDYAGRMELLRRFWDVAARLDPDADRLDEGQRFPVCRPEALIALFHGARLRDVRCEAIDLRTRFSDFDDLWTPFLGGTGPAPSYVATLDVDRRTALAAELRRALPRASDGAIVLVARAWAVCGTAS